MTLHALETDHQIGFVVLHPILEANNYGKGLLAFGEAQEVRGYGLDQSNEKIPKIIVYQVTNQAQSQYKNVGVVLFKAAVQHYFEACGGRVILDAVRNNGPYWYRLGLRASNPESTHFNRTCAQIVRAKARLQENLGSHQMYLPQGAIHLWHQETRENPIQFPF